MIPSQFTVTSCETDALLKSTAAYSPFDNGAPQTSSPLDTVKHCSVGVISEKIVAQREYMSYVLPF